ncbi:MBL fold metallo-hydrolase [Bacillus horti]|uniref:Glyoxylase-like metal-dependent hydrolase (Beta-lactamase superfamily II) n=1 Tax=Caldalkalibacillus horti TaxID=77523 RepID=A0ABT9VYP0_9BACI|nr:MBL fold metallo-hydrolase [Bacillus horti]MDQ0165947.1 glyoxylase-like metal-dependent hydrolase (beta-lactamase superfamily II) [Bacillus horti]
MRITKEKHVYQITFYPTLFPVNCYLIEEEDDLTLIDTALPNSTNDILNAAKQIGKPIKRILLTHAHSDHIGALDSLKKVLPEAQVYISRREAKLLEGDRTLLPSEPQTPVKGGVPKPNSIKTAPDVLLENEDQIHSLVVLSTPGHTPGSISFLDRRTKAIIAGDAFQVRGGVAVSGQLKALFPFPAIATWSKAMALESAEKLRAFQPSLLAVGHGKLLLNPLDQMDSAIKNAKENLSKKK